MVPPPHLATRAFAGVSPTFTRWAVVCAMGFGLLSCNADKNADSSVTSGSSGSSTVDSWPPEGGQGTSLEMRFDAHTSTFTFENTTVEMGDGITVDIVNVDDGWTARANVTIAPDAELGPRDISISTGSRTVSLPNSFVVVDDTFDVMPGEARLGETVNVDILGQNTSWSPDATWPDFGEGIQVVDFTVLTETLAQATVSIDTDTSPGWRNVTIDNGAGDRTTAWDGFKVDRVALAAQFDPPLAEQGDTVDFTIQARGTDFLSGTPRISFADGFGDNPDIVVDSITVIDAENLYGRMTLSSAAAIGDRDVSIEVAGEGVRIPDAFAVIGGDFDIRNVAIDLDYYISRTRDNDTGEIFERIVARCIFFTPLDPPCPRIQEGAEQNGDVTERSFADCFDGQDNDEDGYVDCKDEDCVLLGACGGGGPPPEEFGSAPNSANYDTNGVTGQRSSGGGGGTVGNGSMDCPVPTTYSAGDYVWLESERNVVTLEKTVDSATGMIVYEAQGLTIADYVEENLYDLHTQGDPNAIGEYLLEGVQPTVPRNWTWLYPDLWGNYTHNRTEDFVFRWTPAGTYPTAIFHLRIFSDQAKGPLADGFVGWGGAYPWDDGEHVLLASEMSRFAAGPVPVETFSFISGRPFGFPDSIYQENVATSYIYLFQQMILE